MLICQSGIIYAAGRGQQPVGPAHKRPRGLVPDSLEGWPQTAYRAGLKQPASNNAGWNLCSLQRG